jgi:hypothetical protein
MENSLSKNQQDFKWHYLKRNAILMQEDKIVVELIEIERTKMLFNFDGKSYSIKKEGFWKPVILIEENQDKILVLNHPLFSSKAMIEFNNGNIFTYEVKNSPLVNINFCSKDGGQILTYKLDSNSSKNSIKSKLELHQNTITEFEMVMLIVLGFYLYRWVAIENNGADLLIMTANT